MDPKPRLVHSDYAPQSALPFGLEMLAIEGLENATMSSRYLIGHCISERCCPCCQSRRRHHLGTKPSHISLSRTTGTYALFAMSLYLLMHLHRMLGHGSGSRRGSREAYCRRRRHWLAFPLHSSVRALDNTYIATYLVGRIEQHSLLECATRR